MTDEILGIDLSRWRADLTKAEFQKLHDNGCRFLGVRVSAGLTADETAKRYVALARDFGWVVFGYHFLSASTETDARTNGDRQGAFYATMARSLRLDGHFLDVEDSGLKWSDVIHATDAMRRRLRSAVGLYSRQSYYKRFDGKPDVFDMTWWADYRGGSRWLGNWETPKTAEPFRPGPLWQWTDALKYRRPNGKVRSVDGNVWQGTQRSLSDYLNGGNA